MKPGATSDWTLWQGVRYLFGYCPEGGEHCEHFDRKRGAVSFFRCCKCKMRSSSEVDPDFE